jgi:DNA polymerase III epsilon subunit-like protein
MIKYALFGCDTETTGLDDKCDPIEITLYRMSDSMCKTWCLKPINVDAIQPEALRINGHKIDDLLHKTAEGRARYRKPGDVLVEIENWLMDDGMPAEQRVLLGHNVGFDRDMLVGLWTKCNTIETFPLNQKYTVDTMQMEFSLDYAANTFGEGYSLRNLCKKYGVKNDRAHSAEADTKAMVAIYREQLKRLIAPK